MMDNFNLRVFYELARLKSFSKAAEKLCLTQPAVSKQIKNLEDRLAVRLFLRETKGISLTEEGKILFKFAEKILSLYNEAIAEIDRFRHSTLNKINVGASTSVGEYLLSKVTNCFKRDYPEADIYLKVANTKEILNSLQTFNLAVVEASLSDPPFTIEKLFEDELVLIASTKQPLANMPEVNFIDLKKVPLIIREQGSGTRKILEETLAKIGVNLKELNIKIELDSAEAVRNAVLENLGVSFVSKSSMTNRLEGLKIIPIIGMDIKFEFNLIYNPEKGLTSLTLELIECLKQKLSNQDVPLSCL